MTDLTNAPTCESQAGTDRGLKKGQGQRRKINLSAMKAS